MDITLLIRVSVILGLIAVLDFLVYLVALKFNSYYRHKYPMRKILKMELKKGLEPLNGEEDDAVAQPLPGMAHYIRPQNNDAGTAKPAPVRDLFSKIFDSPAVPDKPRRPEPAKTSTGEPHKFRLDDKVELYGSKGEMTGTIISLNDKNSKSEHRYLVDWGKNGVWWVSEDQIELSGFKKIELDA